MSPSDHIFHALNFLACVKKDVPAAVYYEQLLAIFKLRDLFSKCIPSTTLFPTTPDPVPSLTLPVPVLSLQGYPSLKSPRVVPIPRVFPLPRVNPLPWMEPATPIYPIPTLFPSPNLVPPTPSQPVAYRTISRLSLTSHIAARRKYPSEFINNWAFSVIDATTGQTL